MIDVSKYSDEDGIILASVARQLEELEEHPGWLVVKDFCVYLSEQNLIDSRNKSANILKSKQSAQKFVFDKFYRDGISEGMDLMAKFPGKMLETFRARDKIREALRELDEEDNSNA